VTREPAKTPFSFFHEFYRVGIEKLVDRWQKCVDSDGNKFD
jgi:hypothetical protein